MTITQEIHVDDVGTILVGVFRNASGVVDVSGALTKTIYLYRPGGSVLTKEAVLTTDGTDGSIQYTVAEGDLDIAGVWKIQGFVSLPSGSWHSQIETFRVYPNL
jgi:hypothetical protein